MEQKKVIDSIVQWYLSDTIKFTDEVLFDSELDPQYSAVTLYNRIKTYLKYIELTTGRILTINEFFITSGYSPVDIDMIEKKRNTELEYYQSEQL